MKKSYIIIALLLAANVLVGQSLTQTIRGTVLDVDSQLPLIGATVTIIGLEPMIGTSTDINGIFKLENVKIGRQKLHVSYLGYEGKSLSNILVKSAKEVILEVFLEESSVKMEEIVIKSDKNSGEALNEMTLIGSRSVSAEQTDRYAGGFNDPSRILSNFSGVTSTLDGGNDIIVRGNSPKYIQWRLEGMPITNPNHFGDQSGVGGAISTLNNNLLSTSDFHTGAFAPEFGNVLSGVYDIKLRNGNNEKFESVFGFGLLGTDLTFEGPFSKNYGGSFLVNYRYSTATIINELGWLGDVGGVPKFQDAAFKLYLPTKNFGSFSIFGLSGLSEFLFTDNTPGEWVTPGTIGANQREDFNKNAHLLNLGVKHVYGINDNSYIKTNISYSKEGIKDQITEKFVKPLFDEDGLFVEDSLISKKENYRSEISRNTLRGSVTYNLKINNRNKWQVGTVYELSSLTNVQSMLDPSDARISLIDLDENIGTLRNFVSWKFKPSERFTMVSGFHNMNVLINNESTIEPRLALSYKLTRKASINAGYGLHSNMESVHNYFAQVQQEDGSYLQPNMDLGLLKAHHYLLNYSQQIGTDKRLKVEVYYQDLYNLPVENNLSSHYATINEGLDFTYVDLVNEGTGKNYGIELNFEKTFTNHLYYMVNASFYRSKYTPLDGIERNTSYSGDYLFNFLIGREFENLGKKNNQTLSLNAKVFFGGGKKIIPLLRDDEGNVMANAGDGQIWDYDKAYEDKIEDTHLVVLSASYKWNRKKTTHEIYANFDNITNTRGRLSEYYDEREPDSVGYVKQFGFFPNIMYRLYF